MRRRGFLKSCVAVGLVPQCTTASVTSPYAPFRVSEEEERQGCISNGVRSRDIYIHQNLTDEQFDALAEKALRRWLRSRLGDVEIEEWRIGIYCNSFNYGLIRARAMEYNIVGLPYEVAK